MHLGWSVSTVDALLGSGSLGFDTGPAKRGMVTKHGNSESSRPDQNEAGMEREAVQA